MIPQDKESIQLIVSTLEHTEQAINVVQNNLIIMDETENNLDILIKTQKAINSIENAIALASKLEGK